IQPSPLSVRYVKCIASTLPHTSAPAPLTTKDPDAGANDESPVNPITPTSWCVHGSGSPGADGGSTGGIGGPGVAPTLSNVASVTAFAFALATASPTYTVGFSIETVSAPTNVHVTPSFETYAVK